MYPPPKRRWRPVPYTSAYWFLRMTVVWLLILPMPLELMLPLSPLSQPMPKSKLNRYSGAGDCACEGAAMNRTAAVIKRSVLKHVRLVIVYRQARHAPLCHISVRPDDRACVTADGGWR